MRLQAELVTHGPPYADRARRTAGRITDDVFKAIALRDLAIALAPC